MEEEEEEEELAHWLKTHIHWVTPCTLNQEATREEEIFASQRADCGEYCTSLQNWGQMWGDYWQINGKAQPLIGRAESCFGTRGISALRSSSCDSGCYLTVTNTCNLHFTLCMHLCACGQLQDNHGICRDAEWRGHQGCGPGLSRWVQPHTHTLVRDC